MKNTALVCFNKLGFQKFIDEMSMHLQYLNYL